MNIPPTRLGHGCLYCVCLCVLNLLCSGGEPSEGKSATLSVEQIRQLAVNHMLKHFDKRLEDPAVYHKIAKEECKHFPEGEVYSYVMPALGYVNLVLDGTLKKEQAAPKVRALMDMALIEVGKRIQVPNGDYLQLKDYRESASWMTVLNLGLSAYSLVSDDGHFKKVNDHISKILLFSMEKTKGASLQSWPHEIWHMDTTSALASLYLWDAPEFRHRVKVIILRHLHWRKNNASLNTGLSIACNRENLSLGCDLSYQLCFLPFLDAQYSNEIYQAYCKYHWVDYGLLYGFTEWPRGYKVKGLGDIDSGPVFMEIGGTASGMGVAAAKAHGDKVRYERLLRELSMISAFIRSAPESEMGREMLKWIEQYVSKGIGPEYYTGFLYGDTFLFYTLTWTPYPARE